MTVTVTTGTFGTLPDGRAVPMVTLANANGVAATVIAWGAALQSLIVPDRRWDRADVVLGHATLEEYFAKRQYFGATVGRFANRIAGGRFTLDGVDHALATSDGPNALHGGPEGFDRRLWALVDAEGGATGHVVLRHVSPAGEEGYPGALTCDATFTLTGDDALTIDYRATTDAPTIVNITNHSYWNLAGEGSAGGAMGHLVTLPADTFLPTDAGSIPTGEFRPVEGTPFDFRQPHAVGERVRDARDEQIAIGRGYDHCWVVRREASTDQHLTAAALDLSSGRGFELWSNQPGVQFYSGNFLDGTTRGKGGHLHRAGDALVFEPQVFPDTPNRPAFGSARLEPGEVYRNVITYRLRW